MVILPSERCDISPVRAFLQSFSISFAIPVGFPIDTNPSVVDIFPLVVILWLPKSGDIFIPAIAADAFTSAFTIEPFIIFAAATELFASSLAPIASGAISIAAIVLSRISAPVTVPFAIFTLCTALLASSEFPIAFAAISAATIVFGAIFALVIASFAIVDAIDIFAVPLKLAVPVTSPDTAMFLAV